MKRSPSVVGLAIRPVFVIEIVAGTEHLIAGGELAEDDTLGDTHVRTPHAR